MDLGMRACDASQMGKNVSRHRCFRGTCDEEALRPTHFHRNYALTRYVFCKQSSGVALLQDNVTHCFWYSTRLARAIPEDNELVVFPYLYFRSGR
ncbi:hypothetical protein R75483_03883 [Paraburkholderia domus]|nr:hypothetical protein R75483_03883 [Paraburkholderia domus]